MSNLEELLARAEKELGVQTEAGAQTQVEESVEVESQKEEQAQIDISENPVFKIMSDPSKSQQEMIEELVEFLTAKEGDYAAARENFVKFEEYFAYRQSESIETDIKGIEELIEEVRDAIKPEIDAIVKDITKVQDGVGSARSMLTVIREARVNNKTIESIRAALAENDRLLETIKGLETDLARYQRHQASAQANLDQALKDKETSETGKWNGMVRGVFGPNKKIAAAITVAQADFERAAESITRTQSQIDNNRAQRDESLENGPLTILRSIDATEENFSDNLIDTANSSLDLLRGSIQSVTRLTARTGYSDKAALAIKEKIEKAMIEQATLSGALQLVAKNTNSQSAEYTEELEALDAKINEMLDKDPNDARKPLEETKRMKLANTHKDSQSYEEQVNGMLSNFKLVEANNTEASTGVGQLSSLVQSQKKLLIGLSTEALPATSAALRLTLEQVVVQQTGESALAVAQVTKRAHEVGADSMKDLTAAHDTLHGVDVQQMSNAIDALKKVEDLMVDRIKASLDQSKETGELMGRLQDVVGDLSKTTEAYQKIHVAGTAIRPRKPSGTKPTAPAAPKAA